MARRREPKPVAYQGIELYTISYADRPLKVIVPIASETELEILIRDTPLPERARILKVGPVAKLAEHYGLTAVNYFTDDEIKIFISNNEIMSSAQLQRKYSAIWEIAHSLGVEVRKVWEEAKQNTLI